MSGQGPDRPFGHRRAHPVNRWVGRRGDLQGRRSLCGGEERHSRVRARAQAGRPHGSLLSRRGLLSAVGLAGPISPTPAVWVAVDPQLLAVRVVGAAATGAARNTLYQSSARPLAVLRGERTGSGARDRLTSSPFAT